MSERYVEYSSNNSGGDWWLKDEDWYALEKAGWIVSWIKDDNSNWYGGKDRWLGALAKCAIKRGVSMKVAAAEFEEITGQNVMDKGCSCCGNPHNFSEYDENGKYVGSGPNFFSYGSW